MTLTEQRLIKMWTATDYGGDWYDLNKTLWHIAKVLEAECKAEAAAEFEFLAAVAMWRSILEITERKTTLHVEVAA